MDILKILSCLLLIAPSNLGQNCRTSGDWCGDTYDCCGGCCMGNTCVDYSDADCSSAEENPCFERVCPGGSICQLYHPECEGCEVQTRCVFTESQQILNYGPNGQAMPVNQLYTAGTTSLNCSLFFKFVASSIYYLLCRF